MGSKSENKKAKDFFLNWININKDAENIKEAKWVHTAEWQTLQAGLKKIFWKHKKKCDEKERANSMKGRAKPKRVWKVYFLDLPKRKPI